MSFPLLPLLPVGASLDRPILSLPGKRCQWLG
jgi:hypothetical protein